MVHAHFLPDVSPGMETHVVSHGMAFERSERLLLLYLVSEDSLRRVRQVSYVRLHSKQRRGSWGCKIKLTPPNKFYIPLDPGEYLCPVFFTTQCVLVRKNCLSNGIGDGAAVGVGWGLTCFTVRFLWCQSSHCDKFQTFQCEVTET